MYLKYSSIQTSAFTNNVFIQLLFATGVQWWADGSSYDGDFVQDMRHGKGTHTWANGEVGTLLWPLMVGTLCTVTVLLCGYMHFVLWCVHYVVSYGGTLCFVP